jgi:hypothetical protein
MHRRLLGLRRPGFVLALIVSIAAYAYALSGIVSAGDDLREITERLARERQLPAAHESCRERRQDSVRL